MERVLYTFSGGEYQLADREISLYQLDSGNTLWEEDLFEITEQGQELLQDNPRIN